MEKRKSVKRWNLIRKASETGNMKAQAGVGTGIDAFVILGSYLQLDLDKTLLRTTFADQ
jgi:hypothetical protein